MSKKEENTQEGQEVQDVTSNNGLEWDSFILQNAEESQQLLHRVAAHYGIENEEEASLKMAFNMLSETIAQSPVSESVKEAFKGLENATNHLDRALEGLTGQSFNDFTSGSLREISADPETAAANISTAMEQLSSFIHSNAYNGLLSAINEIQSFIEANKDNVIEQAKEFSDLVPYIRMVIDAEYPGSTFEDFIKEYQAFGDSNETIKEILAKAEAKQAEYLNGVRTIEAVEELQDELPKIIIRPVDSLNYSLDKLNSKIWNLLKSADDNGQIEVEFRTNKKGAKKDAIVYYSINFAALESLPGLRISKQLTAFDKRIYIIAAALYNSGNDYISATQIYKMDHNREPNKEDIRKINDSLTKMALAHISIDTTAEIQINKNYPLFEYDAALLPFERVSAYINGKLCESAIHLFREPPLMTFARERKQVTTIKRQVLLAPISKTDKNLSIEDYLIERIAHMKNSKSKAPRKMLYSTICDHCHITTKKEIQRTPQKIQKFLEYFKSNDSDYFIKDYTADKEGLTVIL